MCFLSSVLSEQDRSNEARSFQTWDLLAWWGGFLILLVPCQSGLDNPTIYSFGKSSNCYSLSSPFLSKVVVGKSEVVAPECKAPNKNVCFDLCAQSVDSL